MRDSLFCPLIKQECKKDECVMWNHDTCLISVYLISNIISSASINIDNSKVPSTSSELVEDLFSGLVVALDSRDEKDAPNEELDTLFSKSAGELADEIIHFAKEENLLSDDERYLSHEIEDLFWSSKGLELTNKELPKKYRSIKKKAWLIAETKLKKDNKPSRTSWLNKDTSSDEKTIASLSNELLAKQLLTFVKEANLDEDDMEVLNRETFEFFWKSKGIQNINSISADIGIKMKQVEKLARDELKDGKSIVSLSNELLAKQLLTFVKEVKLGEDVMEVLNRDALEFFWKSKGIQNIYGVSVDIGIKIKQVEKLARDELNKIVFLASNDELSQELADFAKKKEGKENGQGVFVPGAAHTFWRSKGIGYRTDSLEIEQRKDEIERLAQEIVDKVFHEYRDKRLESEKIELPKLIQSCVVWARDSGRSNITIKDVEFFLLEEKADILPATERALYLSANNELKARKKTS